MTSPKVARRAPSRTSLRAVHLLDLPDEVLMRIICCVYAPDEHWMRHLSSAARIATVCSRLRTCADAVYDPAGPRAAAKTHSLRLGAAASQLPRVEASGVAGLRHCIDDGEEVVQRYEVLARSVGMGDEAWHRQHVSVSMKAFRDASTWLDRFVDQSESLAKCVADTSARLSGMTPAGADASGGKLQASALESPLQQGTGGISAAAVAAPVIVSCPAVVTASPPADASAAVAAPMAGPFAAATAAVATTTGPAVCQGGSPQQQLPSDAHAAQHEGAGRSVGLPQSTPPGCTASPALVVGTGSGSGGGDGSRECRSAAAAGSSTDDNAIGGSSTKGSGVKSSGSCVVGTRLPDVADLLTQVWQLLPGPHRRAGHVPPPLVAAGQQG